MFDSFNVGYYHLVFTIRANSMHERFIKIIYYFSSIRIYYGFTDNICSTTSCTYISHNYLFLKCSTISSTVALRHVMQAASPPPEPELFALYPPVSCGVRHYLTNVRSWPQTARPTSWQGRLHLTLAVLPTPCTLR